MGAMLVARSATASTGRRNASSEPEPEPLIPGLVPDQQAPGAVTDHVHKAIYCRQQPAEFSQPGCLTWARAARAADAGGQMPQGAAMNAGEPATPPDLFGGPPPVIRPAASWLRRALRGGVRCDADALGQRTHMRDDERA